MDKYLKNNINTKSKETAMSKFDRKAKGQVWAVALNLVFILSSTSALAGESISGTVAMPDHLAVGDSMTDFPMHRAMAKPSKSANGSRTLWN